MDDHEAVPEGEYGGGSFCLICRYPVVPIRSKTDPDLRWEHLRVQGIQSDVLA